MAQYQLIGMVTHPEENGWTKESYKHIWEQYEKVCNSILEDNEAAEAKEILSTYFKTDSDTIETHDCEDELLIEVNMDAIYLFQKI